ncbi:hypothetical protein SISNIDRAFT_454405 [Sistotremastrum niveocremeum HHB9708]|uniref:Endoplasmic reticulum protein n=2 Tax=Sistotremastraceae TaxID=3402574 RepID=A0A164UI71_9AGAM|nr:hypothetical protein SISNIDRAFT_454405 [Sistotremastrum niveocremeum HHB9708]KZT43945.1 hypothetical protein SISSUDRAFT_1039862 [Sistotremastrum suecicum HHB10207 ss-3]
MASTQHYVWAAGHFILFTCSLRYLLAWATFKSAAYIWWYKTAFLGALVSYVIVVQKALGTPQPNGAYFKRALADENTQYLLLAFFWWISKPIPLALGPFAIFSLFHTLTFFRSTILPLVFPPPPAPAGTPPPQSSYSKVIQTWVKSNYDPAMKAVAYIELLLLARVVLGALFLQNSFSAPIVYVHFVRQRYYNSTFTRDAIAHVTHVIDGHAAKEGLPPLVPKTWDTFKAVVGKWSGTVLTSQPNAAGGRQPARN